MTAPKACTFCSAPLSQFNPDSACAPCQRGHPDSHFAPKWLWDSQPLRTALAEVNLGKALTIIRSTIGLTQLELASILSWNQSTVQRAEAGTRDTLYDIRCFLEVADALDMPREALAPLVLGTASHTCLDRDESSDVTLDRRQFGGLLAGLAAGTVGLNVTNVPDVVDAAQMRYLQATVDKLYAADQRIGGGTLARDARHVYDRSRRMLDEASYSESTGRTLMRTVGDLAVCAGWLCYDSADHRSARLLWSDALFLAEQAGDSGLAVRALEKMTLQSVRASQTSGGVGAAREAVRLSRRANDLARRDPSPHLHALLAAREAMACAAIGDRHASEAAIGRAWDEVDNGLDGEAPAWVRFVNPSEIAIHEAKARASLGDAPGATRLLRQSLANPHLSARNAANYQAQLSASLAASGDLSSALHEGNTALTSLEHGIASPRTLAELQPLRAAVGSHPQGGDFLERLNDASTHTQEESA